MCFQAVRWWGSYQSHVSGFAIDCSVPGSNRGIGLTADQYPYIISLCGFVDCSLAEFDLRLVLNVFLCAE